jgi:hypothetical protein
MVVLGIDPTNWEPTPSKHLRGAIDPIPLLLRKIQCDEQAHGGGSLLLGTGHLRGRDPKRRFEPRGDASQNTRMVLGEQPTKECRYSTKDQQAHGRSSRRYWIASPTWSARGEDAPSKSAMVLATLSTRSCARADSASRVTALLRIRLPASSSAHQRRMPRGPIWPFARTLPQRLKRCRCRSLASDTRARTSRLASAGSQSLMSSKGTAGTVT